MDSMIIWPTSCTRELKGNGVDTCRVILKLFRWVESSTSVGTLTAEEFQQLSVVSATLHSPIGIFGSIGTDLEFSRSQRRSDIAWHCLPCFLCSLKAITDYSLWVFCPLIPVGTFYQIIFTLSTTKPCSSGLKIILSNCYCILFSVFLRHTSACKNRFCM